MSNPLSPVPQVIFLNEVFNITLTVVNLSSSVKDLVVKVDKSLSFNGSGGRKSSFSVVTYDGPLSSTMKMASPRSAKRMKTFMDLQRMATTRSRGRSLSSSLAGENVFSKTMDDDDEEEEEEEEEDDDEDPSSHVLSGTTRERSQSVVPLVESANTTIPSGQRPSSSSTGSSSSLLPWPVARREKVDANNIIVLNTIAPMG